MTNIISRSRKPCQQASPQKSFKSRTVSMVQRKANYGDKTRTRLCDIKLIALREGKCADSAQMKRRLKLLGIKLDLRLTSAWIAIVRELLSEIAALATPSIKPEEFSPASEAKIAVGARVWWVKAPAFIESWGALEVLKISGEMVDLELVERLVPLAELTLSPIF
jgi:hypothetical protein